MRSTKFFDSDLKVTEIGSKKGTKIAPKGSLLLLVRGSMLFNKIPVGIATRDVTFNQDVKAIIAETSTISEFLLQWFLHSEKTLLGIVGGTGIGAGKLDTKELQSLTYSFPSLPEQQKIAEFLTAVDRRIELLQTKKEKLEGYKKGVMQQIFSQKLRFKADDGSDFPDWEEKKLGEVAEIVTGKTPSTTDESLWSGEIPFVTPTDIIEGNKHQKTSTRKVVKTKATRIIPKGSTFYTCIASIGKMSLATEYSVTNQQINSLIPKPSCQHEYLFYALSWISPKIKATQANTTLPIINKSDFSKFEIPFPAFEEQEKIVQFLTGLDSSIENLNQQINHMQTWKKGLLQKMFVYKKL